MEITRELYVKLAEEEIQLRAHELAGQTGKVEALAEQIENVKEMRSIELKGLREDLARELQRGYSLGRTVRSGQELQPVECVWGRVEEGFSMELIRTDTGEIVESRPMTAQERQAPLDFQAGGKAKAKQ